MFAIYKNICSAETAKYSLVIEKKKSILFVVICITGNMQEAYLLARFSYGPNPPNRTTNVSMRIFAKYEAFYIITICRIVRIKSSRGK